MSPWVWSLLWILWIGAFFAIEIPALANKQDGDTLSEHVWKWFAVKDARHTAWVRLRRWGLIAFLAWLLVHFLTGGWA